MKLKYITHTHATIMHSLLNLKYHSGTLSYNTKSKRKKSTSKKSMSLPPNKIFSQQTPVVSCISNYTWRQDVSTSQTLAPALFTTVSIRKFQILMKKKTRKKQDQPKKINFFPLSSPSLFFSLLLQQLSHPPFSAHHC